MKKCRECDGEMVTRPENHRYDESGLEGIVLLGVPVSRCPNGHRVVGIARMAELHRLIALALIRKPEPLTGAELKALRKHLGYSQEDFASRVDVSREHLSRWETGAQPMSAMAERLVRLMVAHNDRAPDYSLDELAAAPSGKPAPLRLELKLQDGRWGDAA